MTTNTPEQEQFLVERLRSGDDQAFSDLVHRWTPAMLRLADHYLPSREVSEEVVQDAWIAVMQGISAFEGRSSLRTWVFHILVRRAQQTGIRERRSVPFSSVWREERGEPAVPASPFNPASAAADAQGWIDPPRRWEDVPDDRWDSDELTAVVNEAIGTLPRRQAEVLTARDLWGCDPQDVCDLLGLSMNNQRVLLHRARSKVRVLVDAHLAQAARGGPPGKPPGAPITPTDAAGETWGQR